MAEMLIQSESLTSIADKIRVLSGTTESMSLDDMETELGTVDNAVTAALSALVEKGVEVPEGTSVAGLAGLIAAIEVGGESFDPSPFSQILTGTFTTASNTGDFTIPDEAVGTVGFLIVFLMEQGMHLIQLAYVNLGNNYGENALYKHVMYNVGSLLTSTTEPTISTDGRTFSNPKRSMYLAGLHYGYALGMMSK